MADTIRLTLLQEKDIPLLEGCFLEMVAHHNVVSTHFSGAYHVAYAEVAARFLAQMRDGTAQIAALREGEAILGFCKCDVDRARSRGSLDYLVVSAPHRGKGYGRMLMDWAMALFAEAALERIEIKVVEGNDAALRLYEAYGFRPHMRVLWK